MNLLSLFEKNIKEQHLFSQKDKLLLAVSGGVDSVVLCELCKQAGFDFSIAHCNFQLRGDESERDQQFVKELAEKYAIEIFIRKFDTEKMATDAKQSIQETARELRYKWFRELISTLRAKAQNSFPVYLLTAHHADDNIETTLMNFFRGTGLHGLTGIPVSNDYIKRPLLEFSKETLLDFAKENQLEFVEDSTNRSSRYTRNFFRNEIIPSVSRMYPQVKENLQGNINRFKEIEKLYRFTVDEMKKKLCRKKGNEIYIPVKQLMGVKNKALIYELIAPYGFSEKQIEEVEKLATSDSGKFIQSPGNNFRVIKHRHWFIIGPVEPRGTTHIIIEEGNMELEFTGGTLRLSILDDPSTFISSSANRASLDMKLIQFPFCFENGKPVIIFIRLG